MSQNEKSRILTLLSVFQSMRYLKIFPLSYKNIKEYYKQWFSQEMNFSDEGIFDSSKGYRRRSRGNYNPDCLSLIVNHGEKSSLIGFSDSGTFSWLGGRRCWKIPECSAFGIVSHWPEILSKMFFFQQNSTYCYSARSAKTWLTK